MCGAHSLRFHSEDEFGKGNASLMCVGPSLSLTPSLVIFDCLQLSSVCCVGFSMLVVLSNGF